MEKLEQSWATVYTKPAGKELSKEKTRQEIWVGFMAHAPTKATRLQGLCPYLQNKYSNKGRQALNNLRKHKQAKKPLRNSNCH